MSDIIDKAIEILERDGWCRLTETNEAGQHCAIGALQWAALELGLDCNAPLHAENTAALLLSERHGYPISVPGWNDDVAKNVDEVIGLFKLTGEELDLQVTR